MKQPFEAVAVRYVHDPCAEEFLNIGVVVLCERAPFAGARFLSQWGRVSAAFPGADTVLLRRVARAIERRCNEWIAGASRQLALDPVRDVRGLVQTALHLDDAAVQLSPVVSGASEDPERTLAELFDVYAGAAAEPSARSRDDAEVWRAFVQRVGDPRTLKRLERHVLRTRHYELAFDNAWQNGRWNVAQPVSLDLLEPRSIRDKATSWSGRILTLRPKELDAKVYLLVGMPAGDSGAEVREAANDGLAILETNLAREEVTVLTEDRGAVLARKMEEDIGAHGAIARDGRE